MEQLHRPLPLLIRRKITKEAIQELPKVLFPGKIHLVTTPEEADRAVTFLKQYTLLGIDTETRPAFNRGQHYKVALLQVATDDHCFLFRLNQIGLTLPVILLLENPHITKIGLSLKDDLMMLHDSGPGSLREAVEAEGARTVLFAVDGTIELESPLRINHDSITIAGQSAPGEVLGDEELESYVTEETYEVLRLNLADILAEHDDYLDVFVEDMKYSDQPITRYISEDLADIYQDIKDFIFVFQLGLNETMHDALATCQEHFRLYWGQRLVNTLRALHDVKFGQGHHEDTDEEEEL